MKRPPKAMKGPRNSRPLRPRSLAQRKLRPGLPPTVASRTPVPSTPAAPSPRRTTPAPSPKKAPAAAARTTPAKDTAPPPPRVAREPDKLEAANALLLRGEYWELRYGGGSALVEDCRGLRYIATLIQRAAVDPRPMHARELVALTTGRTEAAVELSARDEVLDGTARTQLLKRLEELVVERDRACAAELFERAAQLDDEYERIALELRHAAAGGQKRGHGAFTDAGEKARKAVSKAISEAILRIAAYKEVAGLAAHLGAAIRKGQWLSYSGDAGWRVDFQPSPPRK